MQPEILTCLHQNPCLPVLKNMGGKAGKEKEVKKLLCEMAMPFKGSFQVEFALSQRVFHFRVEKFYGIIS